MRYFVILLAFCLQACSGASSESEFERLVRETGCTTADKVYRDYQRNEVAAQQKYQGSVNRVCGIVDEIELNIINEPVISLKTSGWGVVTISNVDSGTAARMSKGSLAVFDCGGINELLGSPVLTECRAVHARISHDAISRPGFSEERLADTQQPSNFKAANDNALIIGREFAGGGGEAAWAKFDAAFSQVSTFSEKGIPFCNLEVTAYVSYSVPCGYQQNYLYIFTQGLQGIPF